MRVAHFHGGPLHGQTRTVDHTQICVPKPLALNYAALTDFDPIAPALVTGYYAPSNDLDRWDWQGWDDEPRRTGNVSALSIDEIRRRYPGAIAPPPVDADYTSPDAMRLDATTQAAQDEIAAWDAILHPQRVTPS